MRRPLALLVLGSAFLLPASPADAVSLRTTNFVAGFEGFVSCVHADPAGHASIGYGHLIHLGAPTKKDRRQWGCLSNSEGLKLLRKDLNSAEKDLFSRIKGARVSPPMVTALTSFTFNLGAGALDHRKKKGSAPATDIAWHVLQGNYRRAGKEMKLYDGIIVNGKRYELEGLRIRRRKEFRLMIKGIEKLNGCSTSKCSEGSDSGGIGSGAPGRQ